MKRSEAFSSLHTQPAFSTSHHTPKEKEKENRFLQLSPIPPVDKNPGSSWRSSQADAKSCSSSRDASLAIYFLSLLVFLPMKDDILFTFGAFTPLYSAVNVPKQCLHYPLGRAALTGCHPASLGFPVVGLNIMSFLFSISPTTIFCRVSVCALKKMFQHSIFSLLCINTALIRESKPGA